jgi:hypothetical protein
MGLPGLEPGTSSLSEKRSRLRPQSGGCRHVPQSSAFKPNQAFFGSHDRTRRCLRTLTDIWCTGVPNGVAEPHGNGPRVTQLLKRLGFRFTPRRLQTAWAFSHSYPPPLHIVVGLITAMSTEGHFTPPATRCYSRSWIAVSEKTPSRQLVNN